MHWRTSKNPLHSANIPCHPHLGQVPIRRLRIPHVLNGLFIDPPPSVFAINRESKLHSIRKQDPPLLNVNDLPPAIHVLLSVAVFWWCQALHEFLSLFKGFTLMAQVHEPSFGIEILVGEYQEPFHF